MYMLMKQWNTNTGTITKTGIITINMKIWNKSIVIYIRMKGWSITICIRRIRTIIIRIEKWK